MILSTLVVGVLGVSHLGNDRIGNPCFRGQTVGLQGMQMRIKLVRERAYRRKNIVTCYNIVISYKTNNSFYQSFIHYLFSFRQLR